MAKKNYKIYLFYLILVLILFAIDRVTKIYILNIVDNVGVVNISINKFINLILVWNSGIGFGLIPTESRILYNFISLVIILINILLIYFCISADKVRSIFFLIIIGGSLGNLFDRIYYSAVPDFIDFYYKDFHWFIFNFADIFISIGVFCLIFIELLEYKKK